MYLRSKALQCESEGCINKAQPHALILISGKWLCSICANARLFLAGAK